MNNLNTFVVADFDKTITSGDSKALMWIVRENSGLWEYTQEANKLKAHYHPIEMSPDISLEEKREEIWNWWKLYSDLLLKANLRISDIELALSSPEIQLRENIDELLYLLNSLQIPLVIVSATLWWDSIDMFLKNNWIDLENINIITNELIWGKDWVATWYTIPIIHAYNKDLIDIDDFPCVKKQIRNRTNMILLGDSIWDIWLINSFPHESALKVWFLNKWSESLIETFNQKFDNVITADKGIWELIKLFK